MTSRTVARALAVAVLAVTVLAGTATARTSGAPVTGPAPGLATDDGTGGVGDTTFAPLPVGGGGLVSGISFSDDGTTRLVRTDTAGAYRWDDEQWRQVVSSTSLPVADVRIGRGGGVLAVAAAPSDPSVAYLAYNDAVYRSADTARTWTKVLSGVSTAPNDDFRARASRLTVDPLDPDTVYYGTQLDGLYLTHDGGSSWSRVPITSVPAGMLVDVRNKATRGTLTRATDVDAKNPHLAGAGIGWVVVDRGAAPVDGHSSTVYAASYGSGIYRSSDAGQSWELISPSAVTEVSSLRVQANGDVVVTSHADPTKLINTGADVWRLHGGTWSRLTLRDEVVNWKAIAVDPGLPGRLVVMGAGGQLAQSLDYGDTWQSLARTQASDGDVPWLAWSADAAGTIGAGDLGFDPGVPGRLWLTEGTGVWYADLPTDADTVNWHSRSRGIEQLVPTGIVAPPGGRPVMTAWDRAIFRSESLDAYPDHYGPTNRFGSGWSLDWSVSDPSYLVASVASHQSPSDPSSSGYSSDGGQTWSPFPTIPLGSTNALTTFGFGAVAVGAPGNVVWTPAGGKRPHYTLDGGQTWAPIVLPGVSDYKKVYGGPYYYKRRVIAADKTTPGTFYLYLLGKGTFRSTDGGASWVLMSGNNAMRGLSMGGSATLEAVPGQTGHLYLTPGSVAGKPQALLHSTDGGASWSRVPDVGGVTAVGFGKAFPTSSDETVYLAGYVRGVYGIYRSTDDARSWTYLTDFPAGRMAEVKDIDGDKDEVGQLYLAVGGGWVYGRLRPTEPGAT